MPNSLSISAAASQPFVTVTGAGLWSPDQLEKHFRELDHMLKTMRTHRGAARVLVDFGQAKVQTADAASVIKRWTARIYREQDQVAVVCGTSLLAMQMRHQAKVGNLKTFSDRDLAVEWLLAEAMMDAAPRALRIA